MDEILVSINCLTYNHDKYISDAIEGFLMQRTNFVYEILVHDDASTDNTAEIIRKYEKKYPNLVKPIYQTENQHSKGGQVSLNNLARAKGKYIANCEGDDYWTDPYKLQKQVDYMSSHPECSVCVHGTYCVSPEKKKMKTHIRPSIGNRIIPVEEVIKHDKEGLFHTTSFLYPAQYIINLPHFYFISPVCDYPLAIYLALSGYVFYIDEFMSAYRVNTPGSWTSRVLSNNEQTIKLMDSLDVMLDEVNRYSDNKYDSTIKEVKDKNQFRRFVSMGMYKEAKEGKYYKFYLELNKKIRTIITFKEYFPMVAKILIDLKKKIYRLIK